jgi:hypothetical protein
MNKGLPGAKKGTRLCLPALCPSNPIIGIEIFVQKIMGLALCPLCKNFVAFVV